MDIKSFLKNQVSLFENIKEDLLELLINESTIQTYEKDEAAIEFGESTPGLGIILKGEMTIQYTDNKGHSFTIATLKEGDVFGEMALMTGETAMADVVAQEHTKVLLIPEPVFIAQIMTQPGAIRYLSKLISERINKVAQNQDTKELFDRVQVQSIDPFGFNLKNKTPHKLLIINCGSSSFKYSLFDTESEKNPLFCGTIDKIGENSTIKNHKEAFLSMIKKLEESSVLNKNSALTIIGHRVVHGGEYFSGPAIINEEVKEKIQKLSIMAPLHNKINLLGINLAMELFPDAIHVAVFDTTFHHTIPPYAYLYGLPYSYYEKHGIRRYGFHGSSHKYVALKAAQTLHQPFNSLETISCHLGNGASICAIDHGRCVDTSMGFTPSEGLIMGTRTGDIDPGALTFLAKMENMDADQLEEVINKKGGFLGLSGISNDMRELEKEAHLGNHQALLTIKTFCYRLRKYIGSYVAAMQGLDVIVFTGGIGENSATIRSLATQGLGCMGILIDEKKNRKAVGVTTPVDISAENSKIKILVIPTDEERMIARDSLFAAQTHLNELYKDSIEIPIEVSARHVHLAQEHVEALFGKGHTLEPFLELSQPGQYACKEQVTLVGPRGNVEKVRVLGPARPQTQVEIAMTEQFKLGIHPPIRESGDIEDTPGITLQGTAGEVTLQKGVICAMRHIHMTPKDALMLGVRDRNIVKVAVKGERELIFGDLIVRVDPSFSLAIHLDTDEANAADIKPGTTGTIQSIQSA